MNTVIVTTKEQLSEIIASIIGTLPSSSMPPDVVALEILKRKKYLSSEEVSKLYGLNVNTLCKHRANGTGPAYIKDGASVYYTHDAIDQYLASRRQLTHVS